MNERAAFSMQFFMLMLAWKSKAGLKNRQKNKNKKPQTNKLNNQPNKQTKLIAMCLMVPRWRSYRLLLSAVFPHKPVLLCLYGGFSYLTPHLLINLVSTKNKNFLHTLRSTESTNLSVIQKRKIKDHEWWKGAVSCWGLNPFPDFSRLNKLLWDVLLLGISIILSSV